MQMSLQWMLRQLSERWLGNSLFIRCQSITEMDESHRHDIG